MPSHKQIQQGSHRRLSVLPLAALLLVSGSCSLWLGLVVFGGYASLRTRAPAQALVDQYMQDMAGHDVRSAYALFSPHAQTEMPETFLAGLLVGRNGVLFDDYQTLSVSTVDVLAPAQTGAAAARSETARVAGPVRYADGLMGSFCATLEKVDGQWLLATIFVNVPPEKVK